jgi:hypothetical protein
VNFRFKKRATAAVAPASGARQKKYKRKHGNCNVPKRCGGRQAAAWEERLAELAAFKAMPGHGHCNVPRGYPANNQLGQWVDKQRQHKKKYDADPTTSRLTAERVRKLEALGFVWDTVTAAWEVKLAELAAFKAMPGHDCSVPRGYPANPPLGTWVDKQRQHKKKYDADPATSSLTAERVGKLEALGFAWSFR